MESQKKSRGGNTWVWVVILGIIILGAIMIVNSRNTSEEPMVDDLNNLEEVEEAVIEDSELQESIDAEADR